MSWLSRLTNVFRGGKLNRDLDDELRFHIEERTDDLIRKGLSAEEAAREARRMLGSPLQLRESSRDIKLLPRVESILRDAQFGLRILRKNPVVTGAAILSLSLAIGACTAAFSLIDALILRPLPVKDPHQLVYLTGMQEGEAFDIGGYSAFERLREAGREYIDLFAITSIGYRRRAIFDQSGGQEEKVRAQFVSGSTFANLGIGSSIGRVLTTDDDDRRGPHPVAVLSHTFWKHRFARDPNVIGRWLTMDAKSFQIIGVAQEGFWGVEPGFQTDFWVPITMSGAEQLSEQRTIWFSFWGRIKPGVELEQARQALQPAFVEYRREDFGISPGHEHYERVERLLKKHRS